MPPAPDTAMLLHAVERAPDGVLIVDEAGEIVYANRAMLGMSGYPDLEGRSVDEGDVRGPDRVTPHVTSCSHTSRFTRIRLTQ